MLVLARDLTQNQRLQIYGSTKAGEDHFFPLSTFECLNFP